jgi:hypothetical protein
MGGYWFHSIGPGHGPVLDFYVHKDGIWGFLKAGEYLNNFSDHKLIRNP